MELSSSTRSTIGMPLMGFGTYQLSAEQAEFCVKEALNAGLRHKAISYIMNNWINHNKFQYHPGKNNRLNPTDYILSPKLNELQFTH